MLKKPLPFVLLSSFFVVSACSVGPTTTRQPPEQPAPQPSSRAPVESRLPAPEMEKLPPPERRDSNDGEPLVQAPPKRDEQPQASAAVVALLDTAREQAAAGQDEQAAANLERALRIEPKNPWLWHRLGVLRLQQGDYQAAINLANKSNSLAAGNRRLMAGNWELLARAYSALGKDAEAERARRNARELGAQQG